jgi:VWFA-related protein
MRRALVVAALCTAVTAIAAQDQQQPAPTFRSEANYVQLPVRVLDARGEFVGALTQADFQVFEDGAPQTITAFSAVDIPFIKADETVPDAPATRVDPVASNDPARVDGRVYLIVVDDRSSEPADGMKARLLAQGFIRDRLSGNDMAAVVLTSGARSQDFTRNRRLLLDAVNRAIGGADDGPDPLMGQHVLKVIADMSEWMGSIRGRRKALLLITPSEGCHLVADGCLEEIRYALGKAMQSDVSIYTIDPRGANTSRRSRAENSNPNSTYSDRGYLDATSERAARAAFTEGRMESRGIFDGARFLAEESGGFAVVNTNSLQAGLDRIVRDNTAYYMLGYYASNAKTDGRARKIDVRVAREGVQVVHRPRNVAPRPVKLPAADTHMPAQTATQRFRELASSPLPVSAMPLRVAAAPFLSANGKSRVAVVLEMPPEGLRPTDEDDKYSLKIDVSIGMYDREGRSVNSDTPTIELNYPLTVGRRATARGVRIVSRIEVPPGTYRLWAAAVQSPSDVRGSVMTEIHVPDFAKEPLALSGIAVASSGAGRMLTTRTDELLDEVMGAPPAAHREFLVDAELWIYGEIYDHRSEAGDVTANVVVKSADGRKVHETPFEPAPVQFGHLARVPLKELGPGSYVATIEARSATPKPVSVTRTVAFTVK